MPLTQEEIKLAFLYDENTGVFIWKIRPLTRIFVGDVAGKTNHKGYRMIGYGYKQYQAHRLAWLYVYGEWPKDQIDHINGIRTDNRISNLRVVNNRINHLNQKMHRSGKLPGAHFDKRHNRWQALITINRKNTHIGMFATEQEASAAYLNALHLLSEQEEGVTK